MSAWTEEQSMCVAFAEICKDETPWVALGNFGNDFFQNEDRREALIKDPIEEPQDVSAELHRWTVFCAASVEYLCHKYNLTVPTWVSDNSGIITTDLLI